MPLIKEKINPNRRFMLAAGIFFILVAVIIIWAGLNSFLVGLAYTQQKGFWVAALAGILLIIGGIWFLYWSVNKTAKTISKPDRMEMY